MQRYKAQFPNVDNQAIRDGITEAMEEGSQKVGFAKYCMNGFGCFVENTQVLMVSNLSNPFRVSNVKSLTVPAAMPIIAIPIQEVKLLEYAVAHETVNTSYDLTASINTDAYLRFRDKDPYTSDQQRKRDEYKINDTNWNEVIFEEVNGRSTAKLALHKDWINQKGYHEKAVVNLNLPEQGISGSFRITSIRHILPQKKPTDDDKSDNYDYRPVTGIFTHVSDQIYNLEFDNGEELGVTFQHPIYSVTAGDWQLAGALEIGEEVLTMTGTATVICSERQEEREMVYNLEVKDLHNFLVCESGVVVHNSCSISNTSNLPELPLDNYWKTQIQKNTGSTEKYYECVAEITTDAQGKKIIKFDKSTVINKRQWKDTGKDIDGFDFIITAEGKLKIGSGHAFMAEHTGSIPSRLGEDVVAAGKLVIDEATGKIKRVTDQSGHYHPDPSQFALIEQKFIDEGLLYD